MSYKDLILEASEGVALITFNRPKALNALNTALLQEFKSALLELKEEASVKVIILTGAGERAFVAGADLREIKDMTARDAEVYSSLGHECLFLLEEINKVVIAAVNGFALGGGLEVALACDFIIASDKAQFGLPEVSLGLIPGFGGTQRLPRAVGVRMARELIYSGMRIDAKRAMEIGLVNRVVPAEQLIPEAKKVARKIMGNSSSAVAACKAVINAGWEIDLQKACTLERKFFALTFDHEDFKEGVEAFLEKRTPRFG